MSQHEALEFVHDNRPFCLYLVKKKLGRVNLLGAPFPFNVIKKLNDKDITDKMLHLIMWYFSINNVYTVKTVKVFYKHVHNLRLQMKAKFLTRSQMIDYSTSNDLSEYKPEFDMMQKPQIKIFDELKTILECQSGEREQFEAFNGSFTSDRKIQRSNKYESKKASEPSSSAMTDRHTYKMDKLYPWEYASEMRRYDKSSTKKDLSSSATSDKPKDVQEDSTKKQPVPVIGNYWCLDHHPHREVKTMNGWDVLQNQGGESGVPRCTYTTFSDEFDKKCKDINFSYSSFDCDNLIMKILHQSQDVYLDYVYHNAQFLRLILEISSEQGVISPFLSVILKYYNILVGKTRRGQYSEFIYSSLAMSIYRSNNNITS